MLDLFEGHGSPSSVARPTTGKIRGDDFASVRVNVQVHFPHGSCGLTLRTGPSKIPFQTDGLKLKIQHRPLLPFRENSKFYAIQRHSL